MSFFLNSIFFGSFLFYLIFSAKIEDVFRNRIARSIEEEIKNQGVKTRAIFQLVKNKKRTSDDATAISTGFTQLRDFIARQTEIPKSIREQIVFVSRNAQQTVIQLLRAGRIGDVLELLEQLLELEIELEKLVLSFWWINPVYDRERYLSKEQECKEKANEILNILNKIQEVSLK